MGPERVTTSGGKPCVAMSPRLPRDDTSELLRNVGPDKSRSNQKSRSTLLAFNIIQHSLSNITMVTDGSDGNYGEPPVTIVWWPRLLPDSGTQAQHVQRSPTWCQPMNGPRLLIGGYHLSSKLMQIVLKLSIFLGAPGCLGWMTSPRSQNVPEMGGIV